MSKDMLIREFISKVNSDASVASAVKAATEKYLASLDSKDKVAIFKAAFTEDELNNIGIHGGVLAGCTGTTATLTTVECTLTTTTTTAGC
jgi:hypothetical protein